MVQIGDVFWEVPVNTLIPSAASSVVVSGASSYHLNLSAASTAYIVIAQLAGPLREGSRIPQAGGIGTQIKDLVIAYTPTVANLTSAPSVSFFREGIASGVVRAQSAAAYGNVTYEYPIGTPVASLPVAFNANIEIPYVCKAIPATPFYLTGPLDSGSATIVFPTGAGATCRIHKVGFHLALELK